MRQRKLRHADQPAHDLDAGEVENEGYVEAFASACRENPVRCGHGSSGESEVRQHHTVVELPRAHEAELRIDDANAIRHLHPTPRKVVAVDEGRAVFEIARAERVNAGRIGLVGLEIFRDSRKSVGDPIEVEARAYYLEALDLMTKTHDEPAQAVLFSDLGLVARETGHFEEAIQLYERSLALMRRLGNLGGVADAWRMIGRTFLMQKRYDEATACCQTSQSVAERLRDELRVGGARYVLAQCYEDMGRLQDAADLLEQVVQMDRKYHLPKLEENTQRLHTLRVRLADPYQSGPRRGIQA